ncbi:hypothetical protein TWF694_006310 [Orbilia ellipsospora]|uniref:C2H2-type domain-containing protein n=1 Tax=Orbilia ellipsospora TaxID=2528407 RepID=A0AAV9XL54_9PEZI
MTSTNDSPVEFSPSITPRSNTYLQANSNKRAIYWLVTKCYALFEEILANTEPGDADFVETEFGRLNIWASNVGAFAADSSSLDHRLQHSEDINPLILRLLRVLERNLIKAVATQPETGSLGILNNDLPEDFVDAIQSASGSIDRLQTLASLIRKLSPESINRRLVAYTEGDKEDFYGFALSIVRHRFKEAKASLCEQVAASIALRRKRFACKGKQRVKLTKASAPQVNRLTEKPQLSKRDEQPTEPPQQDAPQLPYQSSLYGPSTSAQVDCKPDASELSRGTSMQDAKFDYPPLLSLHAPLLQGEFICPYCCEQISEAETMNNQWWRHHIDNDIEPYSCISEECRTAPIQFVKYDTWLQHMSKHGPSETAWNVHLSGWGCPICECLGPFSREEDFMRHMEIKHAGEFTKQQRLTLAKRSFIYMPRDKFVCPFCENIPEDIKRNAPQNEDRLAELLSKHVACHLKSLAFISLPYRDDISNCSSDASYDPLGGFNFQGNEADRLSSVASILESSFESRNGTGYEASIDLGRWEIDMHSISPSEDPTLQDGESLKEDPSVFSWDFLPRKPYHHEEDEILQHISSLKEKNAPPLRGPSPIASTHNLGWHASIITKPIKLFDAYGSHDLAYASATHSTTKRHHSRSTSPNESIDSKEMIWPLTRLPEVTEKEGVSALPSTLGIPPPNYRPDSMTLACIRYLDLLTPDEQRGMNEPIKEEDLEYQIMRLESSWLKSVKPLQIGKGLKPLMIFLNQHLSMADTSVQSFLQPGNIFWNSLKYLLEVSSRHTNYFELLLDMLGEIGGTLGMYSDYNTLLNITPDTRDQFERLYFEILAFLYKARKTFENTATITNIWHAPRLTKEAEWDKPRLESPEAKLEVLPQNRINRSIPPSTTKDTLDHNVSTDPQIQRVAVINWVSNRNPEADFNRESRHRVEPSGEWLLEMQEFKTWQLSTDAHERILRIIGCPGSGKTVLSTFIIEHLKRQGSKVINTTDLRNCTCITSFYCSRNQRNDDITSILAGLIKGILLQLEELPSRVLGCYERSCRAGRSGLSSADDPKSLLKSVSALFGKIFILVDALEESSSPNQSVEGLVQLTEALPNMHTVLLSRDTPEVSFRLSSNKQPLTMRLDDLNASDINGYVSEQMEKLPFKKALPDIYDRIRQGPKGVFLWANLVMKSIRKANNLDEVLKAAFAVPLDLPGLYDQILFNLLDQLPPKLRQLSKKVLMLLCGAYRPLKWIELKFMLNPTDEKGDAVEGIFISRVLEACGPFVENRSDSDVLVLKHSSVREFFLAGIGNRLGYVKTDSFFDEMEAHAELANLCLSYLLQSNVSGKEAGDELTSRLPLLAYASTFWALHLLHSKYSDLLAGKMHEYLSVQSRRRSWITWQLNRESSGFPLQHLINVQKQLRLWDIGKGTGKGKRQHQDWIQDVSWILIDSNTVETTFDDFNSELSRITYFEKLTVLRDLCLEYANRQRLEEGEAWVAAALKERQESDRDEISTVWLLNSLGMIYDEQHKTELAAELQEKALMIQDAHIGPEHIETTWTLYELGLLYSRLGRYEDSIQVSLRLLEALKKTLPRDNLRIAWVLNNIGRLYRKWGSPSTAIRYHEMALDIQTQLGDNKHPHVLWTMADIGRCYRDEGRLEDSIHYHRQCVDGRQRELGPNHPDTLWAMNDLGLVLSEAKQLEEAKKLHQEALEGQIRVLGKTHPHTLWSKRQIEIISQKMIRNS